MKTGRLYRVVFCIHKDAGVEIQIKTSESNVVAPDVETAIKMVRKIYSKYINTEIKEIVECREIQNGIFYE